MVDGYDLDVFVCVIYLLLDLLLATMIWLSLILTNFNNVYVFLLAKGRTNIELRDPYLNAPSSMGIFTTKTQPQNRFLSNVASNSGHKVIFHFFFSCNS